MKWWDSGNYGPLSREIADEDAKWRIVCRVLTRQYISIKRDNTEPWPEGKANFALILQAPQMLEALEAIRDRADNMMEIRDGSIDWTDWQPVRSIANAAIAAAKGKDEKTNT